ncbi:hypothetical protein ACGH6Q_12235 [Gilliamella sp. BG2]|uniref:hypothetical protein n=1 Tax=Gilliamella sp. BG2 TaxID=3351509 RepID=UPI003987B0D7
MTILKEFDSALEDIEKEFITESFQIAGEFIAMQRIQLFSLALLGDTLRVSQAVNNVYESIVYSKVIKGNQEYADLLIQLINEFESLVREGASASIALDRLIDEKYLERLKHLQSVNKLN